MEKQMNKISLENVKNAYRKLKASIYYDKTQTVFRDKIVDFENSQNELDRKLEQLHKILQFNIDEDEWEKYKNQRLRSISVLTFPKQVDTKNSGNFITNVLKDEVHIEKEQFFFDSDVETQILGSLWTLSVGAGIDKSLEDSSYGNRLKNANKSLYLFKPLT
jgi:regulator of replication initiation timing